MSVYENFDEQKQFACRVIADHARSTAFAIADGILPGNEGRNYVLRKIMRRAIYHGREHLGFSELFFHKVCGKVIDEMNDAYPELEIQRDFIDKMVRLEEERFGNTLTVGIKKLQEVMWNSDLAEGIRQNFLAENPDGSVDKMDYANRINASTLAKLYDTFGTPIDLMFVILSSPSKDNESFPIIVQELGSQETDFYEVRRYTFDEKLAGYSETNQGEPIDIIEPIGESKFREIIEEELKKLQEGSGIGKTRQSEKINPIYVALERTSVRSNFHGYDKIEVEDAKVIAIVKDDKNVKELKEGEEGLIILDETPFYAESGGQVGDVGFISRESRVESRESEEKTQDSGLSTQDFAKAIVFDTFAPIAGIVLHKSKVEKGSISIGDVVMASVDVQKRDATRRNHTATHLVHAALKEVLGTHVKQAGSVVAPNYLRFDFTHYQPISEMELLEIEDLVNREILKNEIVNTDLMSIEDAMRTGAMALFGEKYGSTVRVLSVGGGTFSKELCGGTHVRATGDIGSFKITSDEAVASGVRRIRAITGFDAFERFREDEKLIEKSLGVLRTQRDNLPNAIEKLQEELKKARRENDDLKMKIATGAIGGANSANGDEAKDVNGVKVVAKTVDGLDKGGMRHLSDTLMAKIKSGVVILAKTEDDKVSFIVRVSDDLTGKVSAGNIVREIAPIVGGRGGGKADMAEGGGTDASKLNDALEASYSVIEKMLS